LKLSRSSRSQPILLKNFALVYRSPNLKDISFPHTHQGTLMKKSKTTFSIMTAL
jgi:hypothetical protein